MLECLTCDFRCLRLAILSSNTRFNTSTVFHSTSCHGRKAFCLMKQKAHPKLLFSLSASAYSRQLQTLLPHSSHVSETQYTTARCPLPDKTFSTRLYSLTHIRLRGAIKQTPSLASITLNLIMLMQEEYHHVDMELPYIIVVQPLLAAKFIK